MNNVATTANSGVHVFCVPDISRRNFYVFRKKRLWPDRADQHSNRVPTIAELIDKVPAQEPGRSGDQRLPVTWSIRIDVGPPL